MVMVGASVRVPSSGGRGRWQDAGGPASADRDVKVLGLLVVPRRRLGFERVGDCLGRGRPCLVQRLLAAADDAGLFDPKGPVPRLGVVLEVDRDACARAHVVMLQQLLELFEREAEVLGTMRRCLSPRSRLSWKA